MPLYILETKTASEDIGPGSAYRKRLLMDVQIGAYLRAADLLGWDVHGVGYDVLVKPRCKPLLATPPESRKYTKPTKAEPVPRLYANQRDRDETPEEFEERCLSLISAAPNDYYWRGIIVRLRQEHHESAADLWSTAQSMRDAKRLQMYPRNPDSCVQWSRECEYLSICSGTASIDDPMLFERVKPHEELVLEDDRARVTQSSIRCFRSCQRKYELRYALGIRSLVRPEPLLMGTGVHKGVEELRRGKTLEEALAAMNDPLRVYQTAKARAMLRGYYAAWGPARGIVHVEHQFEVDLVNPATGQASRTFRMAGKMDAVYSGDEAGLLRPGEAAAGAAAP